MTEQSDDGFGPENCKDCRKCGRRPVLTEVTVHDGEKYERRLCEECARSEGISTGSPVSIPQLFAHMMLSPSIEGQASTSLKVCPACKLSFADFRAKGLLGCPSCYEAFADRLSPLIERTHEGATHHTGRVPAHGDRAMARYEEIVELRRQLDEAIRDENYEQAAKLRDALAAHRDAAGHDPSSEPDEGSA